MSAKRVARAATDSLVAPLDLSRQTYLTVSQTKDYLQLASIWSVYRWQKTNRVPTCRVGRSIRFLRRDIDEAVQKSRHIDEPRLKVVGAR